MMTYSFLETSKANTLLLLALRWVVLEDSVAKDVEFSCIEDIDLGKESAVRILEGIREEETEDETRGTGKSTHENEQPEPSRLSRNTAHVEDTVC